MKGFWLLLGLLLAACSFDYGDTSDSDKNRPDIVMEDVEYVRVRGGDVQVRFQAEYVERWEDSQTMELTAFSFEHLENNEGDIDAEGQAGSASVQLDTGNVSFKGGVKISVESEDIIIETRGLEWRDKERLLFGGEDDEVYIERSDGTSFTGRGFSANIRSRTWAFSGEVKGTYVEEDEADEEAVPAEGE